MYLMIKIETFLLVRVEKFGIVLNKVSPTIIGVEDSALKLMMHTHRLVGSDMTLHEYETSIIKII